MPLYPERALLFLRALTPLHVGTGRTYAAHVDMPVQRDEFGYPTIWSSSLKGALKANIFTEDDALRKCFGPYPEEIGEAERAGYAHSNVAITDAKLLLIPARVLKGVYTYLTSPILLEHFSKYVEIAHGMALQLHQNIVQKLNEGVAVVSKQELLDKGRIALNEMVLKAELCADILDKLRLKEVLPEEVYNDVSEKGIVIVPDKDNVSLSLVNRSILIQYRVRLHKDGKTVKSGPWSEEYVPSGTIFVSLILCSGKKLTVKTGEKEQVIECSVSKVGDYIVKNMGAIFVGGKETIGRGLARLYLK